MNRPIIFLIAIYIAISISGQFAHAEEAPSAPSTPAPVQEPAGEITLGESLALALQGSPVLAPYQWDIRAAEARRIQAGLRPNPELSLEVEDVRLGGAPDASTSSRSFSISPADGIGASISRGNESISGSSLNESEITLALSQLIELGGKRAARIAVATREQTIAQWDYEIARLQVLSSTALAFYDLLAAQERLILAERLAALFQAVHDTVAARVDAGKVSPIEATQSEVELRTIQLEQEQARQEIEAARVRLAAHWGISAPVFTRAAGNIAEVFQPLSAEEIQERVRNSPLLTRWAAELDARNAVVSLERANAKPDVTVTAGLRSTGIADSSERSWTLSSLDGFESSRGSIRNEDDRIQSIVVGVSIPLPIFNRNQGRILEAEHLASKASDEQRAAQVSVESQSIALHHLLTGYLNNINSLQNDILPRAQDAFEKTQEGYRQGKFGLLEVLITQRTLFEAQRQLVETQSAFHRTTAELESFTGQSVQTQSGDIQVPQVKEAQP